MPTRQMSMVTDLHCHILPGIDDGSASRRESIEMLKMESAQGIEHVVATPHFYANHDSPARFLERRAEAEERLRQEMEKHEGMPRVSIGAEVYFFRGISDSDALSGLTINKKGCILIEMDPPPWPDQVYSELEAIWTQRGITPIIAHIDRYVSPFRTYHIPERLRELPVLIQANASFFLRPFTRSMAMKMLCEDRIHLLGSDCHNLQERAPNLGKATALIRQKLGADALQRIVQYEQQVLGF